MKIHSLSLKCILDNCTFTHVFGLVFYRFVCVACTFKVVYRLIALFFIYIKCCAFLWDFGKKSCILECKDPFYQALCSLWDFGRKSCILECNDQMTKIETENSQSFKTKQSQRPPKLQPRPLSFHPKEKKISRSKQSRRSE